MKLFLKYTAIVIGIQILFWIIAITIVNLSPGHVSFVGDSFLLFYMPTIALVSAVGNFRGESSMIDPIIYGVPSGILAYGVIAGGIWAFVKHRSAHRNK
jgi:hypothetical protein